MYYEDWCKQIPADAEHEGFRELIKTVNRCKRETFNYFDYPYTNAFVEGMNNVIREISNHGYGYDFEVLRGKIMLTVGHDKEIPKVDFKNMARTQKQYRESVFRKYGVPFQCIVKALKEGRF